MAETLLFDMDGLLLDTERLFGEAFLAMTDKFGVASEGDVAFYQSLVGGSSKDTTARLRAYLPEQIEMAEFDAAWRTHLHQLLADGVPLRPYVCEVLEALKSRGHRKAVVTSTWKKNALKHLELAGILDFFEHVTAGDEVSKPKPDPAPYLETAAHLGRPASRCFAFEDSDRGIAAAVAAGCIATQIPDVRDPTTPLPQLGQRVAPDLRSAVEALGLI